MNQRLSRNLLLFTLISAGLIGVIFLAWPSEIWIPYIQYAGYWNIAALTLLSIGTVGVIVSSSHKVTPLRLRLKPYWIPAALTAVLLSVIAIQERNQPKIFADEILLVGVSLNMHLKREATVPLQGYYLNDIYHTSRPTVDKRPLLYPFLTSFLHDFTGYRPSNAIILNYIAAFALGLAVFHLAWKFTTWKIALAAPPLLFFTPLLGHCVASTGFETLNLLFIVLFLLSSIHFLKQPHPFRLLLMVSVAVLLASVRYESILYSLAIPLFFYQGLRRNPRLGKTSWLPFLPLLYFLPLVFLRLHFSHEDFWQMEQHGTEVPFGFQYVWENTMEALFFFFNFDPYYLNSAIVSILGTTAIIVLLVVFLREWRSGRGRSPAVLATAVMIVLGMAHLCLLLFYHYGQLTNSIVSRLSLPIILHFVLAILLAAGLLSTPALRRYLRAWPAGILLLCWLAFVPPRIAMGKTNLQMLHSRDAKWALHQLESFDRQKTLFLTHSGQFPIIHRFPSTSVASLNRDPQLAYFYLQSGFYDSIVIMETLITSPYSDEASYKVGSPIHEEFHYEVIASTRMNPTVLTRLIRITGVEGFDEWNPEVDIAGDLPEEKQMQKAAREFMRYLP